MFCPGCGNKIEENNKFCYKCGMKLDNSLTYSENNTQNNDSNIKVYDLRGTNGFAIAGFVISLVSIFFDCGLTSPISLILSIIGLSKIKKGNEKGKGFAIAGIIISALTIGFIIIALVLIFYSGLFRGDVQNNKIGTFS